MPLLTHNIKAISILKLVVCPCCLRVYVVRSLPLSFLFAPTVLSRREMKGSVASPSSVVEYESSSHENGTLVVASRQELAI